MAIAETIDVIETQLFIQGDARDPLGVWGFRLAVEGDASGAGIKVTARIAAAKQSAYVYTCYSAIIAQTVGAPQSGNVKCRLLSNWPNVDPLAGVQAYASAIVVTLDGDNNFSAPFSMPEGNLVGPNDRFILLFDPRSQQVATDIVELEVGNNGGGITFSFEGYGYFWDRAVMQAPGGPRHPGAN